MRKFVWKTRRSAAAEAETLPEIWLQAEKINLSNLMILKCFCSNRYNPVENLSLFSKKKNEIADSSDLWLYK